MLEPNKVSVEAWIKTSMTGTGYLLDKNVVRYACAESIQEDAAHSSIGR